MAINFYASQLRPVAACLCSRFLAEFLDMGLHVGQGQHQGLELIVTNRRGIPAWKITKSYKCKLGKQDILAQLAHTEIEQDIHVVHMGVGGEESEQM